MKKWMRLLCVVPAMSLFAFMAIASGSQPTERGEVTVSSSKESSNESSSDNSAEDSKTDDSASDSSDSSTADESSKNEEEKPEYEVTSTNFNYYTNSIGRVEYYGIVEIENTGNCDIYLNDCVFDLEDNDGHLLQSDDFIYKCPDIIAPGEKGYFYNSFGSSYIDSSVSTDNGVVLKPQFSLKKSTNPIIDYEITDTDMRPGDYMGLKFTGRVTNNTDEDLSSLEVYVVCYNSANEVILITSTYVSDLAAGMTRSFDTSTMFDDSSVNYDDIATYNVIARKSSYQW